MDTRKEGPEINELKPMMMINYISRFFFDNMRKGSDKLGCKGGYHNLLRHLRDNPGITQQELVKITNFRAPTISVTLQNMENDGLVRRETDINDQRQIKVFLTEKGERLDNDIYKLIIKTEKEIYGNFSDEEISLIGTLLRKMMFNLTDADIEK